MRLNDHFAFGSEHSVCVLLSNCSRGLLVDHLLHNVNVIVVGHLRSSLAVVRLNSAVVPSELLLLKECSDQLVEPSTNHLDRLILYVVAVNTFDQMCNRRERSQTHHIHLYNITDQLSTYPNPNPTALSITQSSNWPRSTRRQETTLDLSLHRRRAFLV